MSGLLELTPWLIAMCLLMAASGFFSASEAALFYLRPGHRRHLQNGSAAERLAAHLLRTPNRLLSAVLFWNLVVNILYFAVSSVCALKIENDPAFHRSVAIGFAFVSLMAIIFFSELLPKSLAVTKPLLISRLVSLPLSIAVRLTDPIMPLLRAATLVSRRLIWPGFKVEPYMEIADLERAITISGQDDAIIQQEQTVLQNIVQLSDIRIDEWMRPRTQFQVFHSPVSLDGLSATTIASGYLLIAEADSNEIEKAIHLDSVIELGDRPLEQLAQDVLYLPWRTTVAEAWEQMTRQGFDVAVVVNEFGETEGILTIDAVLQAVFNYAPSRTKRILDLNPINFIAPGRWKVSGMMNLKRLARKFNLELPESRNVTVSGVIQEALQRIAKVGDQCQWGPFDFRVIEISKPGTIMVELRVETDHELLEPPHESKPDQDDPNPGAGS